MRIRRPICLAAVSYIIGVYIFTGRSVPAPSWNVDGLDQRTVAVSGTVKDRQIKNGTFQIFLSDVSFCEDAYTGESVRESFPEKAKGIVVVLRDTKDATELVKIGSKVAARGVFTPFDRPRCEGMFDARSYYMIRGYEGRLVRAKITGVSHGYATIREGLRRVRDASFSILRENMSAEDAGLVAAMTLGDKTELDPEIKELYQNAGISHVLALSGLHIASVGLAFLKIMKKTGIPGSIASPVAFSLIAMYSVMTGMSVSTVRAMIMFSLFILANMLGRTYDLLSAAALSALIVVIADRFYIYDSGFLLSFGAVVGIACVCPMLEGIPASLGKKGTPCALYRSVCVSLSVLVVTMPVTGTSFMQFSLCSVIINLAVIPLMGVVLFTGFSGIMIGAVGLPAGPIFRITHYILRIFRLISETSEKIDGNIFLTGKPGKWQTITYATLLTMAVLCENLINNDKYNNRSIHNTINPTGQHNSDNNKSDSIIFKNKITFIIESESDRVRKRKKTIVIHTISAVMSAVSVMILLFHPLSVLEIRNVDVGQGDCALIWGRGVPAVMIDGGSTGIRQVAKYRIVPVLKANRIRTIECCFLSHMDSDHVNGVIEMLEDDACPVRIRRIIISANAALPGAECDNRTRLFEAAGKRGTKILAISSGEEMRIGKLFVRCINPTYYNAALSDPNDDSLVLAVSCDLCEGARDFRALFTGDISFEVEDAIKDELCDVTYLKVAHHGSRSSTCDDFLSATTPELSVISVGAGNSYGHPTPETLARLEESGSRIYRTDLCGEVIMKLDDGRISAHPYLSGAGTY